jgi:alginate O-acetyltransferase complex protein AlgI
MVFSLFFYAWGEPLWVFVLILTALLDYTCARAIETGRGTVMAKLALAMSVTVNLGLLASVKYGAFLVSNLNALLGTSIAVPSFALPLGISFYTFQTLTYVIDVYRGDIKAQRRYPDYLMYLTMYPQLVAGPIVRYSEVAREIEDRVTTPEEAAYGIFRFCVGLGKKVILANTAGKLAGQFLDGN